MQRLRSIEVFRDKVSPSHSNKELLFKAQIGEVIAASDDDEYFRIILHDVFWEVRENGKLVDPFSFLGGGGNQNQRFIISAKGEGGKDILLKDRFLFSVRGRRTSQIYSLKFQAQSPVVIPTNTGTPKPKSVSKSLHIGLNNLDSGHYAIQQPLQAAQADASAWKNITTSLGYKSPKLLSRQNATRSNLKSTIEGFAKELKAGDLFLLTFSGHGTRITRENYFKINPTEANGFDHAWCLFNGLFFEAELYKLYTLFKPGVQIVVVSDYSYSGISSATSSAQQAESLHGKQSNIKLIDRYIDEHAIKKTISQNIKFYEHIILNLQTIATLNTQIKASGQFLAACKTEQKAKEIIFLDDQKKVVGFGGALRVSIVKANQNALRPAKTYNGFILQVASKIAVYDQTPQSHPFGVIKPELDQQRTFLFL